MAATLLAGVAQPIEEVAKVGIVDVGVALTRHQLLQRFPPIAHPRAYKPKRLGFSRNYLFCLALLAVALLFGNSEVAQLEALYYAFLPNLLA